MKFTTTQICISILTCSLFLIRTGCATEVTSITSTFEGGSIPIGGSGTLRYNLNTSSPTTNVTSTTFESRFRFYSKFVASGELAQLFRPNIDYSIGFQVSDPDQIGYRVKIQRRVIGISSINWTGPTGSRSSTGTVGYKNGLVYVNGVLKTALRSGGIVSREARESAPTPPDASHRVDLFLTLSGYKGTQAFTIRESEAAAQVVNIFQNYNTGSAELFFGLTPTLTGYADTPDDSGDSFIITVIFNPTCSIQQSAPTISTIAFTGILQESSDLKEWVDITPQPLSPVQIPLSGGKRFFRSRSLE